MENLRVGCATGLLVAIAACSATGSHATGAGPSTGSAVSSGSSGTSSIGWSNAGTGAGGGAGGSGTSSGSGGSTLVTYSGAGSGVEAIASTQYTVTLTPLPSLGSDVPSYVYQDSNPGFLPDGGPSGVLTPSTRERYTSWTSFSFAGSVEVHVSNTLPFVSARVLPSHAQIAVNVSGSVASFVVTQPGSYAVDFCSAAVCSEGNDTDLTNPLLVFANPLETNVPKPASPEVLAASPGTTIPQLSGMQTVLYFGPGVYDLGSVPYPLAAHQTAYLAGGAYVRGTFLLEDATGAAVRGRGILSGETISRSQCFVQPSGCPSMIRGTGAVQDITVEGITLMQSPWYNVDLAGGDRGGNQVLNVKVLAWFANTDGIQAGYGEVDGVAPVGDRIADSFVKVGDDSIKIPTSNLTVTNCVIWKLDNAAAFQMGEGGTTDISNVTVSNSDVIRSEWVYNLQGVFGGINGGSGRWSNYLFQDIRVENSTWTIFQIAIAPNAFTHGNANLAAVDGLQFKNIAVTEDQVLPSAFQGYDLLHPVAGVSFENVTVAGEPVVAPLLILDANRTLSLDGTVYAQLLLRSQSQAGSFTIQDLNLNLTTPVGPSLALATALTAQDQPVALGDFYGDGVASVLLQNAGSNAYQIWKEPALGDGGSFVGLAIPPAAQGTLAATGDFNGDGYSDLLFWNVASQVGTVVQLVAGVPTQTTSLVPTAAPGGSPFVVVGAGDFDRNGVSDVVLRDAAADLEVVLFSAQGQATSMFFPASSLGYTPTAAYSAGKPGHFNESWTPRSVGIFQSMGNRTASILWSNATTGELGLTNFVPYPVFAQFGRVFAVQPSGTSLAAVGDYNGDGASDLLFQDDAGTASVYLMNYDNDSLYQPGPVLPGLLTNAQLALPVH